MSYQDMSDEEIIEAINESLKEDGRVGTDFVEVECHHGKPVISGRVASDEEVEVIDEIMMDVLEFDDFTNNVWVDDALAFETADEDGDEDAEEEDDDELEETDSLDEEDEG